MITTEVKDDTYLERDFSYPLLMQYVGTEERPKDSDGTFVVLMTEEFKGVVVHTVGMHYVGYTGNNWLMEAFTPFNKTITMVNEGGGYV